MSDKIELHGWIDLVLPTDALFDLSSRAFKLYGYTVWRARGEGSAFPGQERISQDLGSDTEAWSLPTIKRAFAECVARNWMYRERRFGTSSITHVFKSRHDCEQFKLSVGSQAIRLRITGDPTTDHRRSEKENKDSNNNEDSKDIALAPKQAKKERDPNLDHPAFKVWDSFRESDGPNKLASNAEQRKAIVETVNAIDDSTLWYWREVVEQWLVKGYLLKTVSGILDWFTKWKAVDFDKNQAPWLYIGNATNKRDTASKDKGSATPETVAEIQRFMHRKEIADGNKTQ